MLKRFLIGIFLLSLSGTAKAAVIFEQPITLGESAGFISDGVLGVTFDSFVLDRTATVTGVQWFGAIGLSGFFDFTINFHESAGSLPNQSPFYTENVSLMPGDVPGELFDRFSANNIQPVELVAGQEFWISIVGSNFAWYNSQVPGTIATFIIDRDLLATREGSLAYSLSGTVVPLPAALWLFITALGLLALRVRVSSR